MRSPRDLPRGRSGKLLAVLCWWEDRSLERQSVGWSWERLLEDLKYRSSLKEPGLEGWYERPRPWPELVPLWQMYRRLARTRQQGQAIAPTEIRAALKNHGIHHDETFREWSEILQRLDDAMEERRLKRAEASGGS